jgi:hypothetical protein
MSGSEAALTIGGELSMNDADTLRRPSEFSDLEIRAALLESLQRADGCTICACLRPMEFRHLVRFGTANLGEKPTRSGFYRGRGLCNWHFWELRRSFWGAGLAETISDVLELFPFDLDLGEICMGHWPGTIPLNTDQCWVCQELACDEAELLNQAAHVAEDTELHAAYIGSRGHCLPHVYGVAVRASPEARSKLLAMEREHWQRLKHDLAELIRKRHLSIRDERTPREETAPARCIEKLVGGHGRPWPSEGAR